jgi:threonine 3-dehydrogenase
LQQFYGAENVIASDVRSPPAVLVENGPFQYVDVLESTQLSRLVVEENVQTIVHLAAILSATGEKHPQLALKINNEGTQNVYQIAVNNKISVFCPSTIAVFGPSTPKDNTPVDCIMRPSTMYGVTKVFSELLGEYYHNKFGLDYRSIRYPGVISAKAPPGGGTTDYAVEIYSEALLKEKYTCFLSENTALPMMYMPDLLKATFSLINADPKKLSRRVYNLGSMSFTPKQLAASIRRHIPNFQLECIPDFRQAIADSWPRSIDDSESTKDWGWKPDYNIDTMTDAMFEFLREKHNMPKK